MRKLVLFIGFFVLTTFISFAQRFEGGILGGLNASQVDGDTFSGYHKPGVALGGFVQTGLSRTVYVGMELKFMQKGSRNIDSLATDGQIKYIMRLNYVDLPVYLGIRTSDKMSILLGMSTGYLISGKEINDYGPFPEEDQHAFNEFDIQGILGFRFQISSRLYVDLRGNYSVVPIRKQPGDPLYYWKSNQFSNVLSTTVLYRLDY